MAERDTVVVKDGDGNGVSGLLVAIVAIVLVGVVAWFLLYNTGGSDTTTPTDVNVNVELPSVEPAAS